MVACLSYFVQVCHLVIVTLHRASLTLGAHDECTGLSHTHLKVLLDDCCIER
jgi:hypothetical protein